MGGAAMCIGAAYDLSTPTADALSILLPGRTVDGVANTTRINIFEGNIFNPQFGLEGGNTSNNRTIGNVVMNMGNNIINQLLSAQINLAGTTGNGNTTQINIFSYNIFNPQFSLFGGANISNNTTVSNVAINNGNNSSTSVSTDSGMLPWFGGMVGNGNTVQFSFGSGNIFNPQFSIFGGNISNNTAVTNVAMNNGNFSQTTVGLGGWFGTFLFGGGNGNTLQFGFFVSNIWNPQFSFGGGNISYNTAASNTASGNGNNSSTDVSGNGNTVVGGTSGNGNSNQGAVGSGNISNDQVNIGPGSTNTTTTNPPDPIEELLNSQITAARTQLDQGAADSNTNLRHDTGAGDEDPGDTTTALNGVSTSRMNTDDGSATSVQTSSTPTGSGTPGGGPAPADGDDPTSPGQPGGGQSPGTGEGTDNDGGGNGAGGNDGSAN
ncbi:hypothetical protein BHQ18_17045 [Mycolicibacterium flavescens]|uniref:Uncharacterized protein n=1 Tax=Mycolicibacterium flavescens TaxID=1776 RepID=A0A1E3RGF7_MYCFV|nr:hypothetical protein BHQ18_17045 [Mycolicibacterium flavescens]